MLRILPLVPALLAGLLAFNPATYAQTDSLPELAPPAPLDSLLITGETTTWCTAADCGNRGAAILLPLLKGEPIVVTQTENLVKGGSAYHVYAQQFVKEVNVGSSLLAQESFAVQRSDGKQGVPDPIVVRYMVFYGPRPIDLPKTCEGQLPCQPQVEVAFSRQRDWPPGRRGHPRWACAGRVPVIIDPKNTAQCSATWLVQTKKFGQRPALRTTVLFEGSQGPGWKVIRTEVRREPKGWRISIQAQRIGGCPGNNDCVRPAHCSYVLLGR